MNWSCRPSFRVRVIPDERGCDEKRLSLILNPLSGECRDRMLARDWDRAVRITSVTIWLPEEGM